MKNWNTPSIEALEIANTMYDTRTGTVVDGIFHDHIENTFEDGYFYPQES